MLRLILPVTLLSLGDRRSREFITSNLADAVIIIGGSAVTLIETYVAYIEGKPIIAIVGSGV